MKMMYCLKKVLNSDNTAVTIMVMREMQNLGESMIHRIFIPHRQNT